jgi:ATP-dependent DNA helicase RecG
MSSEEKENIMLEFKNSDTDILVATTVVEVGIDVKNASTIIIFDAQSFGLATLHQLRGRIGRGGQKGTCYLVCTTSERLARQRLEYLEDNEDGFEIARYDLASRGPGDISGVRQSGIPDLNVSDIYSDIRILEVARVDAQNILNNPKDINNLEIIAYISSNISDNLIK